MKIIVAENNLGYFSSGTVMELELKVIQVISVMELS